LCQIVHPQHGGSEVLLDAGWCAVRGGRKTLAKSIAAATPVAALAIQSNLPKAKDLTCLARDVLRTPPQTTSRARSVKDVALR